MIPTARLYQHIELLKRCKCEKCQREVDKYLALIKEKETQVGEANGGFNEGQCI